MSYFVDSYTWFSPKAQLHALSISESLWGGLVCHHITAQSSCSMCLWVTHNLPTDRNRTAVVHTPQDGLCACRKAGHTPFPAPRAALSSGPEAVLYVCVSWKVCEVSPWRLAVCARVWHACGAVVHTPAPCPLGGGHIA